MIRQSNPQTYVKVFPYITIPDLSIPNIPEIPYYNYYKPKFLSNNNNNNNNLIYGGKFKKI
jgi:hypothetical protein